MALLKIGMTVNKIYKISGITTDRKKWDGISLKKPGIKGYT